MARKRMMAIVRNIRKSRIYQKLEAFIAFFEEGVLATKLARKIKKQFVILERRINRIIRNMRQRGVPDKDRMYFYRLVRKFLPAFTKVWKLNI